MGNDVLDDIEKGRRAGIASPAFDPDGGAADYKVQLRIATALEHIADSLELIADSLELIAEEIEPTPG